MSASLDELQASFWAAVTWPTGVADYRAQLEPEARARFDAAFRQRGDAGLERLEVYADAYFWRLHGVLAENHPVIAWWLGSVRFRNLATDYVLAHPSTAADLRRFSASMPAFLRARADPDTDPDIDIDTDALADIADIEVAVGDFLHAPAQPSLDARALARLAPADWPALRLRPKATVALFAPRVDYLSLDAARRAGSSPPPRLPAPRGALLVWRKGHAVLRRPLDPAEAGALGTAMAGATFLELCEATAASLDPGLDQSLDALAPRVAGWLRRWVDDEMIVDDLAPFA